MSYTLDQPDVSQTPLRPEARPEMASAEEAQSSRVAVSNIPSNAKKESMRSFFSQCGSVTSVWLGTPRRGLAFIGFETPSQASSCAQLLNNAFFHGRRLRVNPASPPVRS